MAFKAHRVLPIRAMCRNNTVLYTYLVVVLLLIACHILSERERVRTQDRGEAALRAFAAERTTAVAAVRHHRYMINEPRKCGPRSPFLLVLIPSEFSNAAARDAIRRTWCNTTAVSMPTGGDFACVFLLGRRATSLDEGMAQRAVERESRVWGDIVQHTYEDTYRNLTAKTLMGLRWVSEHCAGARYVMKADSDMFVNVEFLVRRLLMPEAPPRQNFFTGYLMRGYAPNRNRSSKWYVSQRAYAKDHYPVFCSGTGYVFSSDLARKMYAIAPLVPYVPLEDVYVGLCLAALSVQPAPPPDDTWFNHWRVPYSSCKYSRLITSHRFTPDELVKYWTLFQRSKPNPCDKRKVVAA